METQQKLSSPTTPRRGRPTGPTIAESVRRARLLEAAEQAIRRHGPGVSMEDVASEAGVTRPIFYRHFGDRAGLARALGKVLLQRFMDRLGAPPKTTADGSESIRWFVEAFVAVVDKDANLYAFVANEGARGVAASQGRKGKRRARVPGYEQMGGALTALFTTTAEQAGGDPAVAEPTAYAAMGMVLGMSEWWLSQSDMPRKQFVDLMVRLLAGMAREAGVVK